MTEKKLIKRKKIPALSTKEKNEVINKVKGVFSYFIFIFLSFILCFFFGLFHYKNTILLSFFADLITLVFVCFIYRKRLFEDIKEVTEHYKVLEIVKYVLIYLVMLFIITFVSGTVISIISGHDIMTHNITMYEKLYENYNWALIFKLLAVSAITEPIMQCICLRDLFGKNKVVYIVGCALLYALANIMAYNLLNVIAIYYFLHFFIIGVILATMCITIKYNTYLAFVFKLIYQVIAIIFCLMII